MLLKPVLVLGFATFVATQDEGGFMTTCQWRGAVYDDERGTIAMYCNNDNWAIYDYDWTVLDTDLCFTNNGGELVSFQNGGYFNTCGVCGVDMGVSQSKFMLTCHCWSDDGVFEETSVDLNETLWNDDGTLGCFEHVGQSSHEGPPAELRLF